VKRRKALLLLGAVLSGCSDPAEPAAGTFRAQLTGARSSTLSGPSNAEQIFTEFPGPQFAIRMYALRGDTTEVLVLRCPGDQPPSAGEYPLDLSGENCGASYSRVLTTPDGGAILLESMSATSGTLSIGSPGAGQTAGSFGFSGTLVDDSAPVGTLHAAGAFSADLL
jgi:hypothetical protein